MQLLQLAQGTPAFIIGLLLAVILGFVLGYVYLRSKTSKGPSGEMEALQANLSEKTKEAQSANGKLMSVNAKLDALQTDAGGKDTQINALTEAKGEIEANLSEANGQIADLQLSLRDLKSQYDIANATLEPSKTRVTYLEEKRKKLEDRIRELEPIEGKFKAYLRESDQLKLKLARTLNKEQDFKNEITALKKSIKPVTEESGEAAVDVSVFHTQIESLKSELATEQKSKMDIKTQMASIEATAQSLKGENSGLAKELASLKGTSSGSTAPAAAVVAEVVEVVEEVKAEAKKAAPKKAAPKKADAKKEKEEVLAQIAEKAKDINFERIGTAVAADKDDLKKIKGIGPFLEEKLNALSIYTFEQISKFNETDEEMVNKAIEFFPGRIKNDGWAKQAAEFMKE